MDIKTTFVLGAVFRRRRCRESSSIQFMFQFSLLNSRINKFRHIFQSTICAFYGIYRDFMADIKEYYKHFLVPAIKQICRQTRDQDWQRPR
jgi:hypothetical protein